MLTVHVFNKYFLFFWVVTTYNRLKNAFIQKRIFYNYRLMWHGFPYQIFLYPYAFWYSPICQFVLQFGKAIRQNIKSTSTYVMIRYKPRYNIFVLKFLPYVMNIDWIYIYMWCNILFLIFFFFEVWSWHSEYQPWKWKSRQRKIICGPSHNLCSRS